MSTFRLIIASVGKTLFEGEAASVTFPGTAGEFTVLAHHEPFITTLKEGIITVRLSGRSNASVGAQEFPVEKGILECSNNRAIVLL
jgi:F-type H+-transporting ATPase subunit epsilon